MAAIRRTYLAGLGAGISLLAGGALVFMVLSALVAFDSMPGGLHGDAEETRTVEIPEDAVLAAAGVAADVPAAITTTPASEAQGSPASATDTAAAAPRTLGSPPSRPLPGSSEITTPDDTPPVSSRPGVIQPQGPDDPEPTTTDDLQRELGRILDDSSRNLGNVLEGVGDTVNGLLRGDLGATRDGLGRTLEGTGSTVDGALRGVGSTLDGLLRRGR